MTLFNDSIVVIVVLKFVDIFCPTQTCRPVVHTLNSSKIIELYHTVCIKDTDSKSTPKDPLVVACNYYAYQVANFTAL